MLHAEESVVRLQSTETEPKLGPRRQPVGHTLRRRQSFNRGNDRLGLAVVPGAGWAPLREAPGGGSLGDPSAAAALSVPAAAAAVTATRAVPANLLLSRAGRAKPSIGTGSQQFSGATSRGQTVDSKNVKASSAQQSAVSKSAAAKLVYSPRSDSAPRKQAHS